MEMKSVKPWYKKPLYWVAGGVVAFVAVVGAASPGTSTQNASSNTASVQQSATAALQNNLTAPETSSVAPQGELEVTSYKTNSTYTPPAPTKTTPPDTALSNNNHYINVDGNSVHSPAYAPSAPVGASAQCRDGTYSFSQHHNGTCSHHGGVANWF